MVMWTDEANFIRHFGTFCSGGHFNDECILSDFNYNNSLGLKLSYFIAIIYYYVIILTIVLYAFKSLK